MYVSRGASTIYRYRELPPSVILMQVCMPRNFLRISAGVKTDTSSYGHCHSDTTYRYIPYIYVRTRWREAFLRKNAIAPYLRTQRILFSSRVDTFLLIIDALVFACGTFFFFIGSKGIGSKQQAVGLPSLSLLIQVSGRPRIVVGYCLR
jgi:hypothetical protein